MLTEVASGTFPFIGGSNSVTPALTLHTFKIQVVPEIWALFHPALFVL